LEIILEIKNISTYAIENERKKKEGREKWKKTEKESKDLINNRIRNLLTLRSNSKSFTKSRSFCINSKITSCLFLSEEDTFSRTSFGTVLDHKSSA